MTLGQIFAKIVAIHKIIAHNIVPTVPGNQDQHLRQILQFHALIIAIHMALAQMEYVLVTLAMKELVAKRLYVQIIVVIMDLAILILVCALVILDMKA